jgi:hypothetical protein
MKRSLSQTLKLLGLIHRVAVKNQRGEVVGEDWAFSLDHPIIDQFLERVGRALLFAEFGQAFFAAEFGWRLNPPIPPEIYQFAVANYPKRRILDVVAYSVTPELDHVHWIIVQFYSGVEFLLRYERKVRSASEPSPT